MKNLIIPNPQELDEKIKQIYGDGKYKLHVLSDFDRTLTKAFVNGQKSPTIIAQIRNGKYLTLDYAPRAHALYNYYHPIEIDDSISSEEKNKEMHKWWKKHFDLLVECGLTKKIMDGIVRKKTLRFRKGALEFIELLHYYDIPLIIMSAGPGDMIKEYLRLERKLYDNIYVVANFLKFDKKGKAIGVQEQIIHSCNKHETEIRKLPFYRDIKNRRNVLLLGDSLEDLGMISGFDYKTLVKIGFFNEGDKNVLDDFKKKYDFIILNDGDMDYVNKVLNGLVRKK